MVVRRGPRGGKIPSGRCSCDVPTLDSVKAVRQFARDLGTCTRCGEDGLRLIPFGTSGKLHPRCLLRMYGMTTLIEFDKARRTGLCCIGLRRMKKLLDATG